MKISITVKSEKRKAKKKRKTLDVVLLCLGIFTLSFVVTMIVIFCVIGSVPDTLIQMVLGAGGVETLATTAITVSKVLKDKNNMKTEVNENEDYLE